MRAHLAQGQLHPEWLDYVACALWSLNERAAGRPGLDLEPLPRAYLSDVLEVALAESEHLAQLQEEQEEETLRAMARQQDGGNW